MAIPSMCDHQTLILSLVNFRKTPEYFLDGFITNTLEIEAFIRNEDNSKLLRIDIHGNLNFSIVDFYGVFLHFNQFLPIAIYFLCFLDIFTTLFISFY